MLVSNGLLLHRFEEVRHRRARLGRHLELDARSLAYTIEAELRDAVGTIPVRPAAHPPAIPILDQGALGSCTGNAGAYALSALAAGDQLTAISLDSYHLTPDPASGISNELFAVALYHRATVADGVPGQYPPDDTGSSGLGVCRALKAAGLVHGYVWATTLRGLGALLQRSGVIVGMPWFEAFFHPDQDGFVDADPRWPESGIAGGHELYWAALESWDDRDPRASVVRFPNSWGSGWGMQGWGRIRLSTYLALRQQIDVKQLGPVLPKEAT
jgi:hypothetical protein